LEEEKKRFDLKKLMFHLTNKQKEYLLSRFESIEKESTPPLKLMERTEDLERKLSDYIEGGVFIDFCSSLGEFNQAEREVRQDPSKSWSD